MQLGQFMSTLDGRIVPALIVGWIALSIGFVLGCMWASRSNRENQ
jgi:hypothetical protein